MSGDFGGRSELQEMRVNNFCDSGVSPICVSSQTGRIGGNGALPQFVLQTKTHPQTLFIQHLTTHQIPSDCRTPREI